MTRTRQPSQLLGGIPPLVALVTSGSDFAKQCAARALANLATNDQSKAAIAAAGGIPSLAALVTSGSDSAKGHAAHALGNLATDVQNKAAIAAAGGISPLVALVTSGSDSAKTHAALALANLAGNDQNKAAIVAAGGFQALQEMAKDGKVLVHRQMAQGSSEAFSPRVRLCRGRHQAWQRSGDKAEHYCLRGEASG